MILNDVMPPDFQSLQVAPVVTGGTESTLTGAADDMEQDQSEKGPETQQVSITPMADENLKARTESSTAPFPTFPREEEPENRQKAAIRERMKVVQPREKEGEPEKAELTRAEENVYERLHGYYRYQSLLSLTYTIAKRRHKVLRRDPESRDGYARKMEELITEIFQSPLFKAGCKECPTAKYVRDLYETYFEECNFERPTIKEFMEKDWSVSGKNGESPQAWMERMEPDFADSAKKRQLAALWNRAEGLLALKITLPLFVPSAKPAPSPGSMNVNVPSQSPVRSAPHATSSQNRSPAFRKPQNNLAARPQERTSQPERRVSHFPAQTEKKPETRPSFEQSPKFEASAPLSD